MKSKFAYTEEIDDLETAMEELKEQLQKGQPLLKNSCGIVMCDYDMDTQELTVRLKEEFDFPVIGCVSMGTLSKQRGFSEMSIQMLVLTADDCEFHVGISDKIESPGLGQIKALYKKLSEQKTEKEKVIFTLASPWSGRNEVFLNEELVDVLDEISGGVPVFGGCAGDGFQFSAANVFFDGVSSMGRVAMILVCGKIKPLIKTEFSTKEKTISKYKVTKSEGRNVYTLNNRSIKTVLEEAGLVKEKSEGVTQFVNTPFISTVKTDDGDTIDRLSGIYYLDHGMDYACFMRNIDVGSELSICMISKEGVETSVKEAFQHIFEKIQEEKEYTYSTIICISCVARYGLIITDKNLEARAYQGKVPDKINLIGMYSFGEFCPVRGKRGGKLYNAYNNETFAILAI